MTEKTGFTLIELAIVLVIIGLLTGGILVAQSMISTAKLVAFTRQIEQIDIAVGNFKSKYSGLPGDVATFSPNGDGNGLLGDSAQGTPAGEYASELIWFWQHLITTGFQTTTSPLVYAPKSKLGTDRSSIIAYSTYLPSNHYFMISDFSASGARTDNGFDAQPTITAAEALSYDSKTDDGLPGSGAVQPFYQQSGNLYLNLADCASSSTVYKVNTPGKICNIAILIGNNVKFE